MRLRHSEGFKRKEKTYSVEHDKFTETYRVIFSDWTGVYQSFENGKAMIFDDKVVAKKNASRFNHLYGVKK